MALHNRSTASMKDCAPISDIGRRRGKAESNQTGVKRYNLVLPMDLFNAVNQLAEEEQTTVVELLRRFIKLGLIAADVARDPNSKLIIREGKQEQEILLL